MSSRLVKRVSHPQRHQRCREARQARYPYKVADSDDISATPSPHLSAPPTFADVPSDTTSQQSGLHYEITDTQEQLYESLGDVRYETLIEIINTGSVPIYLGSPKYDLTDEAGKIIRAGNDYSTYPNILHPGEKGYLYDSIEASGATPACSQFEGFSSCSQANEASLCFSNTQSRVSPP